MARIASCGYLHCKPKEFRPNIIPCRMADCKFVARKARFLVFPQTLKLVRNIRGFSDCPPRMYLECGGGIDWNLVGVSFKVLRTFVFASRRGTGIWLVNLHMLAFGIGTFEVVSIGCRPVETTRMGSLGYWWKLNLSNQNVQFVNRCCRL